MRSVAIIQARMSSSRLPGKVLMPLDHRTTLEWVVRAARAIPGLDAAVVATSDHASDDQIVQWCAEHGVACHRGPLDDVLGRYLVAARNEQAEVVMRLTADCPFLDPHVCGDVIALFRREGLAYASNVSPPTWPDGLSCELMTREALEIAGAEAKHAYEREHVTPFIRDNRHRFPQMGLPAPLSGAGDERWTLDSDRDLVLLREIVKRLPDTDRPPAWTEILAIMDNEPELRQINMGMVRNAAIAKSLSVETTPNRGTARAQAVLAGSGLPDSAVLSHGYGSRVWDVDGTPYVDLVCGDGTVILGHQDPDVDGAIRAQLGNGIALGAITALEIALTNQLAALIPNAEAVRFLASGAEANRAALVMAQAATGRQIALLCGYGQPPEWLAGHPAIAIHGDDVEAFAAHADKVAAIFVAPVSSMVLPALRRLADRHKAILVFDETAAPMPPAWAIAPDLTTLGRSLGNGMAVSAVAGRADLMEQIGSACDALSLAAALAVLEKFRREPVADRLRMLGTMLTDGAQALIRSHGLEDVVELGQSFRFRRHETLRERFNATIRSNGVFMQDRLCLSYAHSEGDIAVALRAFDNGLAAVAAELSQPAG